MNFQEALTNFTTAISLPGFYIAKANGYLSVASFNVLMTLSVVVVSVLLWRHMKNVKA
ncbi:hypothetical protein EVB81_047 [Rhizobium phage RHph_I46]|uniref:Uncharacterized protein n=1 Tax=Rhizobium phage RHph_I1_9 TaxID=2509729 RepID=A0A7S5R9L2_9CAUD|nr:hypothetical protein PP936_gp046 [Rhizobium phage RHph_I1_9]QIG69616.1 hypothetical protein EVB81_047 [Rhizobium phage RHph_I46]QIG70897.1 hypothetical protein EVB92_047 [Rhizobium phage RHph_I9]QIG73483.1 hypothetical protein EVC04_046 [Rhizobium phage RHph_I1_9]QIG76236.1 hypothetical protein EVC25_047 [Rhizobium phage RHph_I34]